MKEWNGMEEELLAKAVFSLCEWYDGGHRELPWRSDPTPYHVWISEIMLQQTRVEAVKPYYARFLDVLPDVSALAQVEDDVLMKLWEGLGYYSRARNLKKAAILCCEQFGGQLPTQYEELLKLPGIGSYTAGAIASIAYGQCVPAVDGNVLRVISRLCADDADISLAATKKEMEKRLRILMEKEVRFPGTFNQALMELGAMVCIPNGAPLCEKCPWEEMCLAHQQNRTAQIPHKASKKARKVEQWTVFVWKEAGMTILRRRSNEGLLAGLYEFPMVKGILDEKQAILWWKEQGYEVVVKRIKPARHIFSHIEWQMTGYEVLPVKQGEQNGMVREGENDFLYVSIKKMMEAYSIPSALKQFVTFLNQSDSE